MNSDESKLFLSGIIEGFYGTCWSNLQRIILFERMHTLNLNTYIYAPKDDSKHRIHWRSLYNEEELGSFKKIINSCVDNEIEFIYALSPGLDIIYSSEDDFTLLLAKYNQIRQLGCNSFGLFFDDIEHSLCERDAQVFTTLGGAQVNVTNRLFRMLKSRLFLFCPTIYCTSYADKNNGLDYLIAIGTSLMVGIDIMWTGDSVISKTITANSLKAINSILRRSVIIWDNLHSNDSRRNMINLGPYTFRSRDILEVTRGIFLNPNTEFESNTVPVITFSKWLNLTGTSDEEIFHEAQIAWLMDLNCSADDHADIIQQLIQIDETSTEPMDIDKYAATDEVLTQELSLEDLKMFMNFFYLPFAFSESVEELLCSYQWLIDNSSLALFRTDNSGYEEWRGRMESLVNKIRDIDAILDRLFLIPNRVIIRELVPYIQELRWTLQHVAVVVTWIGLGKFLALNISNDQIMSESIMESESLPSLSIFGSFIVINELKLIQPIGYLFDLKHVPAMISNRTYKVFVYDQSLHDSVLDIGVTWFKTHWPSIKDADKIAYICIEGMLTLEAHFAFVLCDVTDDVVVVGFAISCSNAEDYFMKFHMAFSQDLVLSKSEDCYEAVSQHGCIAAELRDGGILAGGECGKKITSFMRLCVMDDLTDPNAVLHLFEAMSVALQLSGIDQVCVEIGGHDMSQIYLFCERLGFSNLCALNGTCCYRGNIYICMRSLP